MAQLYSNLKFLRYADHIVSLQEQRVVVPMPICISLFVQPCPRVDYVSH